jgi:hypothetical protein
MRHQTATLTKINRGQEVKDETLQKLAKKLKVPATYFDPPATVQETSLPADPEWLDLMLRNLDAQGLAEMFLPMLGPEHIDWRLNVHTTVDDETIQLLEQLEDAINELRTHHSHVGDGTLRFELEFLRKTRRVASLLEELAKRDVAIVGGTYLVWETHEEITHEGNLGLDYRSTSHLLISIEMHPAQARRQRVWQGKVPPKFYSADTPTTVNGHLLPIPFD